MRKDIFYIHTGPDAGMVGERAKVRGVSCDTPLFSWRYPSLSDLLFRKVFILGSTYTFQPKFLSFLLVEPLTFDKIFLSLYQTVFLSSTSIGGYLFCFAILSNSSAFFDLLFPFISSINAGMLWIFPFFDLPIWISIGISKRWFSKETLMWNPRNEWSFL